MSLKRDLAMVKRRLLLVQFLYSTLAYSLFSFNDSSVTPAQVTQQIFVVEKWAKKSRKDLNIEVQSRLATEKATSVLRLEKDRLTKEIKEALKAQDSAKASLKTTTKQAKEMRQQLYMFEINLATEKQMVSDLKVELIKTKETARLAREAAEAAVATSYERGVVDTEARLTEEVAVVCKDYITMSWGVALDREAVPADSDLRKIENIFFLEDIHEIPGSVPPKEPLSAPITAPDSLISEAKGGNEEVQPPTKDKSPEDALTIRDVVVQAREAVSKPSAGGDHPEAEVLAKSSAQDKA